ncbi:MAG: thermonuclease family protein [Gammaproteobacteria bacterium]|nr:thermonuclease family protein [Gammaproteobacteria bacterium]
MLLRWTAWIFLSLLVACVPVASDRLDGTVVGISDGDTLTLLATGDQRVKIRLGQIDAPERTQPWGNRSRQALAEVVFQRTVRVQVTDIDSYGRTVGTVFLGDLNVNAEMVRHGAAWVYRRYATDEGLFRLEDAARDQGLGLWSLPESQRVPPWQWRQERRGAESVKSTGVGSADLRCGTKQHCSQMDSCAEARFFLQQCAVSTLDADHDGRPCELLCQ